MEFDPTATYDDSAVEPQEDAAANSHAKLEPVSAQFEEDELEVTVLDHAEYNIDLPEGIEAVAIEGEEGVQFRVGGAEDGFIVEDLDTAIGFADETTRDEWEQSGTIDATRDAIKKVFGKDNIDKVAAVAKAAGGITSAAMGLFGSEEVFADAGGFDGVDAEGAETLQDYGMTPESWNRLDDNVKVTTALGLGIEYEPGNSASEAPQQAPVDPLQALQGEPELVPEVDLASSKVQVIEAEEPNPYEDFGNKVSQDIGEQVEQGVNQWERHYAEEAERLAAQAPVEFDHSQYGDDQVPGGNLTQAEAVEIANIIEDYGDLQDLPQHMRDAVGPEGERAITRDYSEERGKSSVRDSTLDIVNLLHDSEALNYEDNGELSDLSLTEADVTFIDARASELRTNMHDVDDVTPHLDANHDGQVTYDELSSAVAEYGLKEVNEQIEIDGVAVSDIDRFELANEAYDRSIERTEEVIESAKERVMKDELSSVESGGLGGVTQPSEEPNEPSPSQSKDVDAEVDTKTLPGEVNHEQYGDDIIEGGNLTEKEALDIARVIENYGDLQGESAQFRASIGDDAQAIARVSSAEGDEAHLVDGTLDVANLLEKNDGSLSEKSLNDRDVDFITQRVVELQSIHDADDVTLHLDANNDGRVTYDELSAAVQEHGLKEVNEQIDNDRVRVSQADRFELADDAYDASVEEVGDILEAVKERFEDELSSVDYDRLGDVAQSLGGVQERDEGDISAPPPAIEREALAERTV